LQGDFPRAPEKSPWQHRAKFTKFVLRFDERSTGLKDLRHLRHRCNRDGIRPALFIAQFYHLTGLSKMPEQETLRRVRKDEAEGKSPSVQAGEFVREEIHHVHEAKHSARLPSRRLGSDCPRRGAPG
jgi:hypothetical protein